MPQHRKPARLYFKKSRGWIIIDGNIQRGTGCSREQLREAQEAFEAYLAENHRPDTRKRDLAQIGCADVINLYNSEIAPALPSAATIGYQGAALLKFWADKTLADVKGSTCRAYVKFRTAQKLPTRKGNEQRFVSPATARQELKLLGRAINHWHKESPLAAVPKVSLPQVTSKRERVLERNEVAALLRAARRLKLPHVIRFILIGLDNGTRHSALLKLKWNANLVGGHVDLEHAIIYRRGSAERETKKRRPPVRITRRLLAHLVRWAKLERGKGNGSVIHYRQEAVTRLQRSWRATVKEANLGPEVTPHTLRHTCASWLLRDGVSAWDVSGIIGADVSTVERIYGHHKPLQDERKRA